jgi:hypothetical protein
MKNRGKTVTSATKATTAARKPMLSQVVAVRPTIKNDTIDLLTARYRTLAQAKLLSGLSRTYKPHEDGGFKHPDEINFPQLRVERELKNIAADMYKLFDVTAALDWTNQHARADIVLWNADEPVTLLRDVPVTYLMFLEKQLLNVEATIKKLPILDPAEDWTFDPAKDIYRSAAAGSIKTKKVKRNHVIHPGNDKHAPQVETYTEDEPVGTWSTIKFSGALPAERVNKMLARVTTLIEAVKFAREQANMQEIIDPKPGRVIFDYLFASPSA